MLVRRPDCKTSHRANRIKAIINGGYEPFGLKLHDALPEVVAFALETKAIAIIGRRIRHTGPLVNQQRGGSGASRRNPAPPTPEAIREKIRKTLTGRKLAEAHKAKLRGKPAHNRGKKATDEQRQKMSASRKGKSPPNKGKSMSPDKYQKCAATMFKPGRIVSVEERERNRIASTGMRHTDEAKAKISAKNKGKPNPFKGQKRDPLIGAKVSATKKGKPNTKARGVPRPRHVIEAMQAGRKRQREERRRAA